MLNIFIFMDSYFFVVLLLYPGWSRRVRTQCFLLRLQTLFVIKMKLLQLFVMAVLRICQAKLYSFQPRPESCSHKFVLTLCLNFFSTCQYFYEIFIIIYNYMHSHQNEVHLRVVKMLLG